MLAIRLQRVGRKGLPIYRVAVQEAQRHPSSGRVVAYVGAYNPHTKETRLNKEKIEFYLKNGAQPSPRLVKLMKAEKIKLPSWVGQPLKKKAEIKNLTKLRKNRPADEEATVKEPAEAADKPAEEEDKDETAAEEVAAAPEASEETKTEKSEEKTESDEAETPKKEA